MDRKPLEAALFCGVAWLIAATILSAQEAKPTPIEPLVLVKEAVRQEVASANGNGAKHMFKSHRKTPKGSQTKLYVETNDAMAGMLIAVNDQPITEQQKEGEANHLSWLMNNPEQLRKKNAREKEDAERTLRIVKALPDAFCYQYEGTEDGMAELSKPGDQLIRLKFRPNPGYSPPSHVEQVLQGMEGYLLIDAGAKRLARMDGTLFRDVSFGWGIIGHLDKGGHFRVQQADVGDGSWELTSMNLKISGKILFFKSISMVYDEAFTDFRSVPRNLPFAKGVEMLKSEAEKLANAYPAGASSIQKATQ